MMESLSSEQRALAKDILLDIQTAIEKIKARTSNIRSADDFLDSPEGEIVLDATCMLLIAIGESLKNLDKVTEGVLLPTDTTVPWKQVKGMRDIIAHHYFDVDAGQIFWILSYELTPLEKAINNFISFLP
jgi:uncharacterized protein with HEPN domain